MFAWSEHCVLHVHGLYCESAVITIWTPDTYHSLGPFCFLISNSTTFLCSSSLQSSCRARVSPTWLEESEWCNAGSGSVRPALMSWCWAGGLGGGRDSCQSSLAGYSTEISPHRISHLTLVWSFLTSQQFDQIERVIGYYCLHEFSIWWIQ